MLIKLQARNYYVNFKDEQTETHKVKVIYSMSHW